MPAAKYFIAIVLPDPLRSVMENMKQDLFRKYGLKGALRSPAHITLHRPFEWKEEKEDRLIETLRRFKTGGSFTIHLRNFGSFEPRVIYGDVVPNEELFLLHTNLVRFAKRELNLFNEAEDLRGFQPHITLAFRDLKKPLFYTLREQYSIQTFEEKFHCDTISLLKHRDKWEVIQDFPI